MFHLDLILSSALAVALVTAIKEIIIWILNRKAKINDDESNANEIHQKMQRDIDENYNEMKENVDKIVLVSSTTNEQLKAISHGTRLLLQDKILTLSIKYIEAEEITHEQRKLLHEMWDTYHHGLNGNGDLDPIMELVNDLPLKIH